MYFTFTASGSRLKPERLNGTLSATPLLVSLKQGDNSFFIYSSPGLTPIIFLPWHNPSVGKPTAPLKQGRNQVAEKPEGLLSTINETLSEASPLVSLIQGDNSFYIFLPWP